MPKAKGHREGAQEAVEQHEEKTGDRLSGEVSRCSYFADSELPHPAVLQRGCDRQGTERPKNGDRGQREGGSMHQQNFIEIQVARSIYYSLKIY